MHDIRRLLKKIVTNQGTSAPENEKTRDTSNDLSQTKELDPEITEAPSSPTAKSMSGVVLFPPEPSGNTSLALLSTPKKKPGNSVKSTGRAAHPSLPGIDSNIKVII
jgi:hypothetical protein